jgi:Putative transposase of IS4/5 family (DUF4096)
MRYALSEHEWTTIKPMLPNKPRGVRRVDDRRILNGIFWILKSGAPWRDLPDAYNLLQPVRSLAASWCMGSDYGRAGRHSQCGGADYRHVNRSRAPARSLHREQ